MTLPDHPRVAEVVRQLREAGVTGDLRELADGARTPAQAAAALGVPVGAVAAGLVFDADGHPLLVLTSAAHGVDTAKVAGLLGVRQVRRADPDFVRAHTGQPVGGVAPVGHPAPIGTLVDLTLSRHPQLWAAAGTPHTVFPTTFEELLAITAGTAAEVDAVPEEAL